MPAAIQIISLGQGNKLNFGPGITGNPGVTGGTLLANILIVNIGNSPLVFPATNSIVITPIVGAAGDFTVFNPPNGQTLLPGVAVGVQFVFIPTSSAGTAESASVQINSNAIFGPTNVTVTGTAALNTDKFLIIYTDQSNPVEPRTFPCYYFGPLIPGLFVATAEVTLVNPTTSSIGFTLTPLSGYTIAGMSGPNPIPPGGVYKFQLGITPVAGKPYQDDPNACTVVITGGGTYPVLLEVQYSTPAIVPFKALTDASEAMMLGFLNSTGQTVLLQADPSNLSCEEDAWFSRQFDMKSPEQVKQLERFLLRYEQSTTATPVLVTYASVAPANQVPVATRKNVNLGTGSSLDQTLFDASIAGPIVSVKVLVSGSTGPLSVAMFILYYEPRGETIENT